MTSQFDYTRKLEICTPDLDFLETNQSRAPSFYQPIMSMISRARMDSGGRILISKREAVAAVEYLDAIVDDMVDEREREQGAGLRGVFTAIAAQKV